MIDFQELLEDKEYIQNNDKLNFCLKYLENPLKVKPSIFDAINISCNFDVDLHPNFLFYWNEIKVSELIVFLEFLLKNSYFKKIDKDEFFIYFSRDENKRIFEILGIEHCVEFKKIEDLKSEREAKIIVLDKLNTNIFLLNLGLDIRENFDFILKNYKLQIKKLIDYAQKNLEKTSVEILNFLNFIGIRDKGGTYIGARMGRPEKAKMRKQFNDETRSIGLFPVGEGFLKEVEDLKTGEKKKEIEQNRSKNIIDCLKTGYVIEDFRTFYCLDCKIETIYNNCPKCNKKTYQLFFEKYTTNIIDLFYVKRVLFNLKNLVQICLKDDNSYLIYLKEIDDFLVKIEENKIDEKVIRIDLFEKLKSFVSFIYAQVNLLSQIKSEEVLKLLKIVYIFINSVFYKRQKVDLSLIEKNLRNILGKDFIYPKTIKGISSTINKNHTCEHVSKAFFREKNKVFVNKDGTIRYDMIEMGITHVRVLEIGTSIEKLKELGYKTDYLGCELKSEEQIIELFPQDVILPNCPDSGDEFAVDFVINTGNFVDDLLENLYKLPRFYNFKSQEDTIGHLIIGLAPHTSAGIVGRILGYSKTQGCFSHPVWHAAQRRNLDGDENGILLLLDGLINFSREYLPDRRGSRTMDVSLVLTSHLYLDQIDDEVHGMDIVNYYPLDFYRANKKFLSPKDVKIEKIDKRIMRKKVDSRYLGYGFTHSTKNFNDTVLCSSYKSVPSMSEKLDLQLNLGRKLRCVDENKVGSFVIDKHFMKDIKGNLRKFSMQTFRCTKCNTKYRRPPLCGRCTKCGNLSINFTIHEGSIKKYLNPSFKIIEDFNIDPYIVEVIELTNLRVEGVFGKDLEKQKSLKDFFGK